MEAASHQAEISFFANLKHMIGDRFSLHLDKADDAEIEVRIREGVELRGATPWILMFAIFIASVGLNVNSTAVIIGAMLISPLMGPIMGAGLGIAIYDFSLLKRSLVNLGIATLICLAVSALYFVLTPLKHAQTELLSRTMPTLWDVLIALFGGMAGIIGITRRGQSNVIPGVAIATALMPPACTAGFGLATGQWSYLGGALYLYTINCVFISLATIAGIRILRLKPHVFADPRLGKRVKMALFIVVIGTTLPSVYLAYRLVQREIFKTRAQNFVAQAFNSSKVQVVDSRVNPENRSIEVSLIGEAVSADKLRDIQSRLATANLKGAKIVLHQVGDRQVDVTSLRSSLLSDLLHQSQEEIQQRDAQLQKLNAELAGQNNLLGQADNLAAEIRVLYPGVRTILLGRGIDLAADGGKKQIIYLNVSSGKAFSLAEQRRITKWFAARMMSDSVVLHFDVEKNQRRNRSE